MTFRIGQKVVCIGRVLQTNADPHPGLIVGKIYTVADVLMKPSWLTPGLLFEEIAPRKDYAAFESLLFRPIVDKKTDIGFAHEILRKVSRTKETAA